MGENKMLFVFVTALCSLLPAFLSGQVDPAPISHMEYRETKAVGNFQSPPENWSGVDTAWARIYNGPGNAADEAHALAVDGQGNVYVTGFSRSASNEDDYATIKYNANGVEQWVKRYNGPGNDDDQANAIAVDGQGNVYVTGFSYDTSSSIDYATIKYNSNGDTIWVRRYSGPGHYNDIGRALVVDGQGNVYVTGESYSSNTAYDYLTIKYYANGDTAWIKRYCGYASYYDFGSAIAVDGQGNVYVTGLSTGSIGGFNYMTIKYNSNGDSLWASIYNGPGDDDDWAHAIAVDGQGNVYVTGESNGSNGWDDYATIKYNANGDTVWLRRYNGPGNTDDQAYAIAVDGQGNVYVTGESPVSGTSDDYATIKYNSNGDTAWVRRYNGPGNSLDRAYALAIDVQGNVYVTGGSRDASFVEDYATIKYNANGDTVWVRRYNGPGNSSDIASAIAVDDAGNVYVTGASFSSGTYNNYATIKYVQIPQGVEEERYPLSANRFALNAEPNPFKTHTAIRYLITAKSNVILSIYDISGKLVKTLVNEYKKPGDYTVIWHGQDNDNRPVARGVYFVKVSSKNSSQIEKIVVIR